MNAEAITTTTPFRFDLDLSANARTHEEQLIALQADFAAAQERHKAELADARAEGVAEGKASTEAMAAEALASHILKVADSSEQLLSKRDHVHRDLEKGAAELSMSIGRFLADAALKKYPEAEIEALMKEAMDNLSDVPILVLHLPQTSADDIKPKLNMLLDERGFAGRLIIKSEPEWTDADIKLEWADGKIVRDRNSAEAVLKQKIAQYFEADR